MFSGGTSSGPIVCDDGSSSTWSVTVAAFTMAVAIDTPLPGGTGNASGDYVLDLGVNACGSDAYSQIISGAVTGNIPSGAPVNLVLHGSGFLAMEWRGPGWRLRSGARTECGWIVRLCRAG